MKITLPGNFSIEGLNIDIGFDVVCYGHYEPAEPTTFEHEGCPETIEWTSYEIEGLDDEKYNDLVIAVEARAWAAFHNPESAKAVENLMLVEVHS